MNSLNSSLTPNAKNTELICTIKQLEKKLLFQFKLLRYTESALEDPNYKQILFITQPKPLP